MARGTPEWRPTAEAALALGVSVRTLQRLKASGFLRRDRHWKRQVPDSCHGPLLWHVARSAVALGLV
jgi:hypothetical protein